MIKTLHITSIIVAILAASLLIFAAVFGVRTDPKIEEFLKAPGAVDKFTAAKGQRPAKEEGQGSPLVRQAAVLAQFLNPPPPPQPQPTPGTAQQPAAQPAPLAPVSTKFNLIATSYHSSNPDMSLALIDEPGKGLHWVKQGNSIAHLTIEKIGDGSITIKDGTRTSEMSVKVQESWRGLLKNPPPETRPVELSPGPPTGSNPGVKTDIRPPGAQPTLPGAAQRVLRPAGASSARFTRAGAKVASPQPSLTSPTSPSDNNQPVQQPPVVEPGPAIPQGQDMGGGMGQPTAGQADTQQPAVTTPANQAEPAENADTTPSAPASEKESKVDQLMKELSSSKVTDDEAGRMEKLAEALKQLEQSAQGSPDANSAEPNAPADPEQ